MNENMPFGSDPWQFGLVSINRAEGGCGGVPHVFFRFLPLGWQRVVITWTGPHGRATDAKKPRQQRVVYLINPPAPASQARFAKSIKKVTLGPFKTYGCPWYDRFQTFPFIRSLWLIIKQLFGFGSPDLDLPYCH